MIKAGVILQFKRARAHPSEGNVYRPKQVTMFSKGVCHRESLLNDQTPRTRCSSRHAGSSSGAHTGFTTTDVLITIGIIGVLMGMLFPAVQLAREAARRTECKDRLRQIGLGVLHYEGTFKYFPPGILAHHEIVSAIDAMDESHPNYWENFQYTSFLALVLRQLDQASLADLVPIEMTSVNNKLSDFRLPNGQKRYPSMSNTMNFQTLISTEVPGFVCPSDNANAAINEPDMVVWGGGLPTFSLGDDRFADVPRLRGLAQSRLGATSYVACCGATNGGVIPGDAERNRFLGIMRSRAAQRFHDVSDGLSNTILLGETIGTIDAGVREAMRPWYIGGVARSRGAFRWQRPYSDIHPNHGVLGNRRNSHIVGFGSGHPGLVNFCMGDGSIRAITHSIDWQLMYPLGGSADGELSSPD